MEIHKKWTKTISDAGNSEFFAIYLEKEKEVYKIILLNKRTILEGKVEELAAEYKMDTITFAGFLDGINSSLKNSMNLDELTEESNIKLEIDFKKLLYNMYVAKANWLYQLPEWDEVLSKEEMLSIKKQYNVDHTAVSNKVGRNDPCPCGSGKKYKKCCGK